MAVLNHQNSWNLSAKIPLKLLLIIPFVLQIVMAVGLTGWFSVRYGKKAVNEVATQLGYEVSQRIDQKLSEYLSIPHQVNQVTLDTLELGYLQIEDFLKLQNHFIKQVQRFDLIVNLLSNALKFTFEGRVVLRVSRGTSPHHLHFEVEDTGIGIEPEELSSLFIPFIQSRSGQISQQGTGLGLSVTHKFIELMGGEIRAISRGYQFTPTSSDTMTKDLTSERVAVAYSPLGSRFEFEITIELAESISLQSAHNQRVIGLVPGQPTYRILVVDDRWSNRQLLLQLLGPLGFEVQEAENGQQAIEVWEDWQPHLIWMDMRMPVMDGYTATEYIKQHLHGQATVIIALTASVFEEEKVLVLSSGCDDFVRKPFRESVILEKMKYYLGIDYVYEILEDLSHSSGDLGEIYPFQLAMMPREWLEQLEYFATGADGEQIVQLLEHLSEEQVQLRQTIATWVNRFQFEDLVAVSQEALRLNNQVSRT